MKRAMILTKGQKFESNGSTRFAKDILEDGIFIHPATRQEINIDSARRRRLADNTNLYVDRGNKVPFPDGHTTSALANMGEWPGFMNYGSKLIGVVDIKDEKAREKAKNGAMDGVSVCIEFDFVDSKGNHYPEVITHVAATDYPVINNQKEFVALSSKDGLSDLMLPKDLVEKMSTKTTPTEGDPQSRRTQMDFAKLIALLGLAKDTPEAKVLEEAEKKLGSFGDVKAQMSALEGSLKSHGLKLSTDGKIEKLESAPLTEREQKMQEQLSTVQSEQLRAQIALATAKAETLVKSGKVPPHLQAKLQEVLAIAGDVQTLTMSSTNPKEVLRKSLDLPAKLAEIFEGIPSIVHNRLSQLGPVELESKKKEEEVRKSKAKELADRNQAKPAK